MGESFGGRIVVLGSRSAGGSGLGGGPQTSGGEEIVGKRMPERMSLRLDEPAHGKKAEAVVLAVCMDPLDALAQGVHGLARLARHPLPPRLETDGLLVALADAPRQAGQFDVVPVARRRRKDADWACDMIGERDDVLAGGVARVDQEPVGRLAVAARGVVDHRPPQARVVAPSVTAIETITPSIGAAAIWALKAGRTAPSGKRMQRASGSLVEALGSLFLASSLAWVFARAFRSASSRSNAARALSARA